MHELYILPKWGNYFVYVDGKCKQYSLYEPLSIKYCNKLITGKTTQHINRILRVIEKKNKTIIGYWMPDITNEVVKTIKKEILKMKLAQI
jgi:hypothetical protein